MKKLIEKIATSPMRDYPYMWCGSHSSGALHHYCDERNGITLSIPSVGEFVFKSQEEGSQAFEVSYLNDQSRRIRVRPTTLRIQYNESLREHLSKSPNKFPHPRDSKVSLIHGDAN